MLGWSLAARAAGWAQARRRQARAALTTIFHFTGDGEERGDGQRSYRLGVGGGGGGAAANQETTIPYGSYDLSKL